jgi:enoyl-CoA hydratase
MTVTALTSYQLEDSVATITMDDGKVNVLSPAMQRELAAAFDRAETDRATVILTGRPGILSAGFDLKTLNAGGADAIEMLRGGFELASRILSFPHPVVVACPGHAIAMGFFLLLSGDYRIGVDGEFRLVANEVAIGLPMPRPAMAIMRHRLTPGAAARAAILAEPFSPAAAVASGVLDLVVPADALAAAAADAATRFSALDLDAHAATKRLARADTLDAIRDGVEIEYGGSR